MLFLLTGKSPEVSSAPIEKVLCSFVPCEGGKWDDLRKCPAHPLSISGIKWMDPWWGYRRPQLVVSFGHPYDPVTLNDSNRKVCTAGVL